MLNAGLVNHFAEEDGLVATLAVEDNGHAGGLAARVEFKTERLEFRFLCGAIFQANGEREPAVKTARPRSKSSRARFSEHGIKGFWCRSQTKTIVQISFRSPAGGL